MTLGVWVAPLIVPARAATGYRIEVEGEHYLVLDADAQQRLGQLFGAKDAEIAALRARIIDRRKADCNLL
ncbi:MAG: hypothetical protein IT518_22270 [Burkholderiales bacterium]|nr:hypothetical protein [Burkholderiales bacterium]